MNIGYLGAGVWGYSLARLLALKGYNVRAWTTEKSVLEHLIVKKEHPKMPGYSYPPSLTFTSDIDEVLASSDLVIEAVTSAGIRPVFERIRSIAVLHCPIILTSKGIEQNTGLLLSEVVLQVLGEAYRSSIGCLSGPSLAEEVLKNLPTSVVCSAYEPEVMSIIHRCFSTSTFRVYRNFDINGVELGGALKNIIAIACGISDGLGFGDNTKAALMTRGLNEMRKLAFAKGCQSDTLSGLSGMGDLCVTCLSNSSRNHRFGRLIAEGFSPEEAKKKIGMVVEGMYTVLSAVQLANKYQLDLPITQAVYGVLYENLLPRDAVRLLLQREAGEENL